MTRYIDADALIEAMTKFSNATGEDMTHGIFYAHIAPTIDAVPVKRGKWLPKHHYIAGYEFVSGHICSECGDDALNAEGDEFLTDYCPNCGARMDEE